MRFVCHSHTQECLELDTVLAPGSLPLWKRRASLERDAWVSIAWDLNKRLAPRTKTLEHRFRTFEVDGEILRAETMSVAPRASGFGTGSGLPTPLVTTVKSSQFTFVKISTNCSSSETRSYRHPSWRGTQCRPAQECFRKCADVD